MKIQTKRIYEKTSSKDGFRILVDRLWPRGMKKEEAGVDLWMKEIAPSTELRQWFHGGKGSYAAFRKKYEAELKKSDHMNELKAELKKHKTVTFLYGSKDEEQNHALILKAFMEK